MKLDQILIAGSSPEAVEYLQDLLSSCAITDVTVANESEMLKRLRDGRFYVLVFHHCGKPTNGWEVIAAVQREAPYTPFVVITEGTADLARWKTAGAFDCLVKPVDGPTLLAVLQRALTRSQLSGGNRRALSKLKRNADWPFRDQIVGDSEAMQAVYHWISKVAKSEANVCLYGESGTGKELVARAIHDSGPRRDRPFVVLDGAAVAEGVMESEMFGHVRGAFTSAVGDRVGVFQLADTGTLFLDEVAELPVPLQAKLLRVIQNREFRRVGSSHATRVDVRILAATNQDLKELVTGGLFREDLFYRLDVISTTMPPLRQRREDIPLLVDHFVQQFNRQSEKQIRGVTGRTLKLLLQYNWPGNVRELKNCIERAGVMAEGDLIDIVHLPHVLHLASYAGGPRDQGSSLREMEKALIVKALRQTRGNKTAAAALLGISLRGLQYKLKRLEPDVSQVEPT